MNSTTKAALVSAVFFTVIIAGFVVFWDVDEPEPPRVEDGPEVVREEELEADSGRTTLPTITSVVQRDAVEITVEVVDVGSQRPLTRSRLGVSQLAEGQQRGSGYVWDSSQSNSRSGRFEFQLAPGSYELHAQCAGFSGERVEITVVRGQPQNLVVELDKGTSISGRVLDRSGRGVSGARVLALKDISAPDADLEEMLIQLIDLEKMTSEEALVAETVSAEDGSYQLDGLQSSALHGTFYTVRAVATEYTPAEQSEVPAPRREVDLTLSPGGVVSGVVVDQNGGGVADAIVEAYIEPTTKSMFQIIQQKSRPPMDVATTGGNGSFRFETLGDGVFNFVVQAPGHQATTRMKEKVYGETEFRFELMTGLDMSGVVLGPDDEPVVGARIRHQKIGGSASARPEIAVISFDDNSVSSDERGAFTFDTLGDGEYNLIVYHPDYQTLRRKGVRPETGEISLRMAFGGRIRGVVTSADGVPVMGARLVASDVADFSKETVTDQDGSYVLSGLQTGRRHVSLTVNADGFARARRDVTGLGAQELEEDFELDPTGRLVGRVVDSNGEAVEGARVEVKRSDQNQSVDYTMARGQTDSSGRFEVSDVESSEELWIRVKHRGYLATATEFFSMEVGAGLELPDIVLQLGGTIAGRVEGPNGEPVSGCEVTVRYQGQTDNTMATNPSHNTRSDGRFVLRGLEAGSVDLVAKPVDFVEATLPGINVVEGQVNDDVVIRLERGSSVGGRIVDDKGEPVPGATITARDFTQGASEVTSVSHVDGRFTVNKILSEATVEIEVTHPDFSDHIAESIDVGRSDVEIVLTRLGKIYGRVKMEDGTAVGAFTLQPQPEKGTARDRRRLRSKTFNFDDGRFEYTGVPPGTYTIQINAPDFGTATVTGVIVEAGSEIHLRDIVLSSGGSVGGRVIDTDTGEPVFGARISVVQGMTRFVKDESAGRIPRSTKVTDSNGGFSIDGLKSGSLTLRIHHVEYLQMEVSVDPGDAGAEDLEIAIERGATIHGEVLNADGEPRPNMNVFLRGGAGDSDNKQARTSKNGKFRFNNVRAGSYEVRAHTFVQTDAEFEAVEVDVEPGQTVPVRIQMR